MIITAKSQAVNLRFIIGLLWLGLSFPAAPADAYQLAGYKWPQTNATFYVDIAGANGLWNTSFENAMASWSTSTLFDYQIIRGTYEDPCDSQEGRNGVAFSAFDCDDAWGSTTLAMTHTWYYPSTGIIIQSDIVFNNTKSWNVFTTPMTNNLYDFQRVAVHELGHALGLGHEDSGVPTIMKSYAGNIQVPQQDDINAVSTIYGALSAVSAPPFISVPSSDADGNYSVNWGSSATSGVTYVLEEAASSGFTVGLREAYRGSGISASITGRSGGVTYYYRVKAIKSGTTDSDWVTGNNGCTVALMQWTVTPLAGSNGSISPSTAQTVYNNATTSFMVTSVPGYQIYSISGCGGSLSGSTYTTEPITDNCSVTATFSPITTMSRDGVVTTSSGKSVPDISDALAVLRYCVNLTSFTATQLVHGDVAPLGKNGTPQGDGAVNISDALGILRRVVGLAAW